MTVLDPLQLLQRDRADARARGDAMANLACLATSNDGRTSARMLVLRDLDDGLALFFSATSPKADALQHGGAPEVLVYLPSLNIQYRLSATLRVLEPDLLRTHWLRRPAAAKRIDWFYNAVAAQSTQIASRDELQRLLAAQAEAQPNAIDAPPPGARGYYLDIDRVERLHIQDVDPPHDRRLFMRERGHPDLWHEAVLVP